MERIELSPIERRILGSLIEKSLTTPQYYPLTLNALVNACNQKSNRDPLSSYGDEDVFDSLQILQKRGLVTVIYPAGGRTEKWRQELTGRLELSGAELAVVAELLLRGPQSVGDLRARASRMKPVPDQETLQGVLNVLQDREPPIVIRLSPEGVRRGVRVTHGLYSESELEEVRKSDTESGEAGGAPASSPVSASARSGEMAALAARVEELEARVRRLEELAGRVQ